MKAYLKWFYGYRNFGDELLLLGVIKRIFSNYEIKELVIESGDKTWLELRLKENLSIVKIDLSQIEVVPIQQHKYKIITHLTNFLALGKYKKYFKFFGWWEVLNTERKFPRNGRNIPLLHRYSVRNWQFVLLWGIWKSNTKSIVKLYKKLLPKAQKIVLREKSSYDIVDNFLKSQKIPQSNIELYHDFSLDILEIAKTQFSVNKKSSDYLLINVNSHIYNDETIQKIRKFCTQNPEIEKIFFPCDMSDDLTFFKSLQKEIPDLILFDRTKHSLIQTLSFLANAKSGIGARLHFLYPLKIFKVPFEAMVYKAKVQKMILSD